MPRNSSYNTDKMEKWCLKYCLLFTLNLFPIFGYAQLWDSLGTGLRGPSRFHYLHDGNLMVSIKDTINSMNLSHVGVWDGSNWDTLGGGLDGPFLAASNLNGDLYIGGDFAYAGGASFPDPKFYNLAKWDGVEYHITDYQTGIIVQALATYNNELYIGVRGPFDVNGVTYSSIARFDGTNWNDVGGGVFASFKEIICMTHFNGDLIVAGRFDYAGSVQANNIARWDGTQWYSMGDGLSYYVRSLYMDTLSNELYAGGSFTHSGSTQLNYIAKWDGNAWQPLGSGLNGAVYGISLYKGGLYAGTSPYYNPSAIMRFDGTTWSPVLPSPNKLVYCLNVFQDALYASGSFDSIGGIPYAGIARYRDTITSVPHLAIEEDLFEVSPNPANEKIEIRFLNSVQGKVSASITDATGKLVLERNFTDASTNLILYLPKAMKNGTYTCRIQIGEKWYSKNFVLQK
ncbi:MAG: T9SS type A sorting domain-containing protein [Bacteroidia bacterium]|nr:T9SS type A sorting domain-containing protein [Bacteroidia bacterium]